MHALCWISLSNHGNGKGQVYGRGEYHAYCLTDFSEHESMATSCKSYVNGQSYLLVESGDIELS